MFFVGVSIDKSNKQSLFSKEVSLSNEIPIFDVPTQAYAGSLNPHSVTGSGPGTES